MQKRNKTEDIVASLLEISQRMLLRGDNSYRAKAYKTAAENLGAISRPLPDLIAAGELTSIPGIGSAIAGVIERLYKTGTDPALEKLREEIPADVLQMLSIPGLRSDKILKLYKETGIKNIDELQKALELGKLDGVKGFTPAFRHKILQGIKIRYEAGNKMHIHRATALLHTAIQNLKATHPQFRNITIAGDLRRQCELVEDLSLVVIADKLKGIPTTLGNIKIHLATEDNYGSVLLFATGAPSHLQSLVTLAKKKKMTLTEKGLKKGQEIVAAQTEEDIYNALGLGFIPPELREDRGEIERAMRNAIPQLVTLQDIHGILHAHTVRSDGINTLEEMANAAQKCGFTYLGVTDHSQSAYYAGGMKEPKVTAQMKESDRLNKKFGESFHIFKGIESDILADGALDYPDEVLERFDFIIASIHSRFKLDKKTQTERIIRAVKNPYTTVIGHLTGRQLLRRPGYELDIEAILKACAKYNVAVEINAHPWRLDFDWRWHQKALDLGCLVSINPDAHSTGEIDNLRWGIAMARKGGIPPDRVLNCMNLKQFSRFLQKKKLWMLKAARA